MKDPAFLFYPGDWMQGTHWMTFEQKGCYFELLLLQFNTGQFTEAQAKQVLRDSFEIAWPELKQKFILENGFYFNTRLRFEIEKRKKFTESRRNNGLAPKKKKENNEASEKHMHKHMGNKNRNKNKNINIDFVAPEFIETVNQWLNYKKKRGSGYKDEETIKIFYNHLLKLSSNDPAIANQIINYSIASNYSGIFEPKSSKNGNSISKTKTGNYQYQPA